MAELTSGAGTLALFSILAYLLGSVPFGLVMARVFGLGDLRQIGSGNIGATNVLRTGNKPAAFLTLVLDAGKGGIAVVIARGLAGEDAAQIAGLAAFLGHLFPVWLGFRGGKGVATFLGTVLALAWPLGLIACGVWLAVAFISRYSSLSALIAAATTPVAALMVGFADQFLPTLIMAIFVWLKHSDNIARLRSGTETKIGGRRA
ncbi:MAG: glycerol-3-phosphate 1-O-acyltransferase PlsY [Pseudomonadota bacterium]